MPTFEHQTKALAKARTKPAFGFFMDMGTGKTKVTIDRAQELYAAGEIDAMLVAAPNLVHTQWLQQLQEWCRVEHRAAAWFSSLRKAEAEALEALIESTDDGLHVLTMNIEAFATKRGLATAERFLKNRRCLFAVDESSRIKNPSAKTTKNLIRLGRLAPYRLIMTGTPYTECPGDAYAQMRFLDPKILGMKTYTDFRARYAELLSPDDPLIRAIMRKGARHVPQIVKNWRRLDELKAKIEPYTFRVRKQDCLDLPDKVYERRPVPLHREQEQAYRLMAERLRVELESGTVSAQMALTKLLRLQQILGGFVTDESGRVLPVPSLRINVLMDVIRETRGSVIIWARFVAEIKAIEAALKKEGHAVVAYHGSVDRKDRERAVAKFHNGEARFFVGQPHSGGIGLNLTRAETVIYFSNDFSLETRLQSEDRAHRIGTTRKVTYIDLEAPGTIDMKVIDALRSKKNMANMMTGDLVLMLR